MVELKGKKFEFGIDDEGYPESLRCLKDPPKRLYGIGNPKAIAPGIGIIGARKASSHGLDAARRCAKQAAKRGFPVISGGARGCDQEAHKGALESECPTVVVFGTGADVIYPESGTELFQQIIDTGGVIVSEAPWGTPPIACRFVERNRIIAALSELLVVAEAGIPSGTLGTAETALSLGKTVAAVPGGPDTPGGTETSDYLATKGARLVYDEETLEAALDATLGTNVN